MWNIKRRQQMSDLEDLLRRIAMLDRSTGAITDLPMLIKKAEELRAFPKGSEIGVDKDYKNFVQFLTDEAFKNE